VLGVDGHTAFTTSSDADPILGVGNDINVLLSYNVDDDGTLSLLSATPTQAGAAGVAVTPDGKALIVANQLNDELTVFNIVDPSSPQVVGGIPIPGHPIQVVVDPHNQFFAVLTHDQPFLTVFTVDDSGNLRSARAATDIGPRDMRIDAEGKNVYVLCDVRGKLLRYEIIDSQVPVLRESTNTGGRAARWLSISNSEALLLVANGFDTTDFSQTVRGFRITPQGMLTEIDEPPAFIDGVPTAIAITAPPNPQATPSPTSSPASPATSSDPAPTTSPATTSDPAPAVSQPTSSPTLTSRGGGGGGGCSMVPAREGASVPWLAVFGNLGLPCMALALMQTLRWRRGKR
jgi:6-phosphogluconolactonase (cycloisomerase 2 family)